MPTYDYVCESCEHRFEQWQSFNDAKLTECPACHTPNLKRLFGSGAAIVFKGSGFYDTDYRRPDAERKAKAEGKTVEKGDGGESKPAASGESKPAEGAAKPAEGGTTAPPASPPPASSGESKS